MSKISIVVPVYWNSDTLMALYKDMEEKILHKLGDYEIVYMTDYGVVYHSDISCTYLELSIRAITKAKLYNERNEAGSIYYKCEKCDDNLTEMIVYITDYGNRYHTSLNCSGLKRSIHVMWLSEVNGLGGCSKCVY